jgi:hypothetical protein
LIADDEIFNLEALELLILDIDWHADIKMVLDGE